MVVSSTQEKPRRFSDELEAWLVSEREKTLGSLIATFEDKSFAILFVLLLGVPALPLPTGAQRTSWRSSLACWRSS